MALQFAERDALPNDWRTRQPGFVIWALIGGLRILFSVIFYGVFYIPSSLRQSSTWTYRQALTTCFLRIVFDIIRQLGFGQALSLEADELGDRWAIINPASADAYRGAFTSDVVKPETIGGTWYPGPPLAATSTETPSKNPLLDDEGLVVLSFHSGSFLWMTGRPDDAGLVADLLNQTLGPKTRSFWPQYRLAGGNTPTPYPGPMQDAVTAYLYLVKDLQISPSRIVLAGDSSGATIAIALLRYLATVHDSVDHPLARLPPPKACLMFSPSVEYSLEGDLVTLKTIPNHRKDYCEGRMMAWGACAFAPPDRVRLDDPYLSAALHPFATPVPLFVQAGGAELLSDSIKGFAGAMRAVPGNRVEYLEVPDVPHDIYIIGSVLGWKEEQEEILQAAARFVNATNA